MLGHAILRCQVDTADDWPDPYLIKNVKYCLCDSYHFEHSTEEYEGMANHLGSSYVSNMVLQATLYVSHTVWHCT